MLQREIPESEFGKFQTLMSIVERLRAPAGCPRDREQTHRSLKRNLLEECYEVLEAIDSGNPQLLADELGDILVQVAFHVQIAHEAGEFALADVLTSINRKLVHRHPHVFSDAKVSDAREVERNWEKLKAQERSQQGIKPSPVDGIPKALPALTYAQLMQDRVARVGFDWEDLSGVLDKVVEEVGELRRAVTDQEKTHELGDLLFSMVNLARRLNIHAEDALHQTNLRFQKRYARMEDLAASRDLNFSQLPLAEKELLWQEAKKLE
jgi:tetrapyrrole methylase family protein/MazG family protein